MQTITTIGLDIAKSDASIIAAGMMIPTALAAARALGDNGLAVSVLNVPVIRPLDADTVVAAARRSRVVVTAENHTVMGGLGSAVAEALAEAGSATPLRRIGICDVFGESGSREYLFTRYGLNTQHIVDTVWRALVLDPSALLDSRAGLVVAGPACENPR